MPAKCQRRTEAAQAPPGTFVTNAVRPERRAPGRVRLGSTKRPSEPAHLDRAHSHWGLRPNRARCRGRRSLQDAGHEHSHRKDLVTKELETGDVPAGKATQADLCVSPKQGHWRAETRGCESPETRRRWVQEPGSDDGRCPQRERALSLTTRNTGHTGNVF